MSEIVEYDTFIWLLDPQDILIKCNTRTNEEEKVVLKYRHNKKEEIYEMGIHLDIFSLDKDTLAIVNIQKNTVDIFDLKTRFKIDATAIQGYSLFMTNKIGELRYIISRGYSQEMYKVVEKKIIPMGERPFGRTYLNMHLNRYIAPEGDASTLYDVLLNKLIITNIDYKNMRLLGSPHNTLIYTSSGKTTLIEWDIKNNKIMREIKLPFTKITKIKIIPHGNSEYFIIVTREGQARNSNTGISNRNYVYSTKTGSYYTIELHKKSDNIKVDHLCGVYLRLLRTDDRNDSGVAFNILTKKVIIIQTFLAYSSFTAISDTKVIMSGKIIDFSAFHIHDTQGTYVATIPIYKTEDRFKEFLELITENTITLTSNIRRLITSTI